MSKKNFLLGFGERLTAPTEIISAGGPKKHPYQPEEARKRLIPRMTEVNASIKSLPAKACPGDNAVVAMTLHPTYIAKSYHPDKLFQSAGLRAVGSKAITIKPEKSQLKVHKPAVTSQFYVAGQRSNFETLLNKIQTSHEDKFLNELIKFEDLRSLTPDEKIKQHEHITEHPLLEIVLHANEKNNSIIEGFEEYLADFDLRVDLDKRIFAGGLCFLPLKAHKNILREIASFSFVRVLREMPSLRQLQPLMRALPDQKVFPVMLPTLPALDKNIKVAIFDGGLSKNSVLKDWASSHDVDVSSPVPDALQHGMGVTSALLFGTLKKGEAAQAPFCNIDHYRVIDEDTNHDPQGELFDVLNRITKVLKNNKYDFFNLSLGPDLPIEDDDVHVWTAKLDDLLASGTTLASVAVGNSGLNDHDSGNARIQPPADCVNALSVGAADSLNKNWSRANYSSIGPGRSPGLIKPDVLAFGGCESEPFWIVNNANQANSYAIRGTSFAAPYALRTAVGVRALLGDKVAPLALKALLINTCQNSEHDLKHVGRGRIHHEIEDILICANGEVKVLYQGKLAAKDCIRAQIPFPAGLKGNVEISATLCFTTHTDPQDPLNYTRSGMDIKFRPNDQKVRGESKTIKTKSFFQKADALSEDEMRDDAHKWETVMHKTVKMRATSLNNPVFDIHYNARTEGGASKKAKDINYALVITVTCKNLPDIYDRVVTKYRTILEPMTPVIDIPIAV